MAAYDGPEMLSRLVEMLRLPVDDNGVVVSQETGTSNAALYRTLSTADADVMIDLAARVPWAIRADPILLTSSDGSKTYPFVDINGTTVSNVMGHVGVFIRLEDIPDYPLIEGRDFIIENAKLRIPHNRTWPYATGPYVQLVTEPIAVDATHSPVSPMNARVAVLALAAKNFCMGGGKRDWRVWKEMYDEELAQVCLMYHTQVQRQAGGAYSAGISRIRLMGGASR